MLRFLCEVTLGAEGIWGVPVSLLLTVSVKKKLEESTFPKRQGEGG